MKKIADAVESRLFRIKEDIWLRDLSRVVDFQEKNDVPFCVDGGILLALVRDGRLLPNRRDTDVDLSVPWNSETYTKFKYLRREMAKYGMSVDVEYFTYKVKRKRGGILNGLISRVLKRMGGLQFFVYTPVNISLWRESGDFVWTTWLNKPGVDYAPRVVPKHFYEKRNFVSYNGLKLPVPAQYEEYLSFK